MSGQYLCPGRDDKARLCDEHSFLERQLGEAISFAEADDWQGFERRWESFISALEQHMQYEENQVFPAFAKTSAAASQATKELCTAHARARSEVKFLDGISQVPDLFIEQLRYLAQVLREHREQEDRALYPWLDALPPENTFPPMKLVDDSKPAATEETLEWGNPLQPPPQGTARLSR